MKKEKLLLIGIGNAFRRDDGAGLAIARRFKELKLANTEVIETGGEGGALMDLWKDWKRVLIFDAVSSGSDPGSVYLFNPREKKLPAHFFRYSTHAFSLAETIELARALNQLPEEILIYGIEGKNFETGEGLSPEVERAVERICSEVREKCTNFHSSTVS